MINYLNQLNSFGKNLKELRLAENLTQKQVATAINITYQSYQAYEAGISMPTLENFLKLCNFFNITPNDLLDIN